jgi:LPXTG-site transpeptidase (sortase) family protein
MTLHKPVPYVANKQLLATGLPARLKIPRLDIDVPLDHVGLTANGDMEAPKLPEGAAWYSQGPRPGEKGSAVIDGHYGWVNNVPAIFDNLHALRIGDSLYIRDERGVTVTFVIRSTKEFTAKDDATTIFHSQDGKAHLNLITCQGSWNQDEKSFSNRYVIFADRI